MKNFDSLLKLVAHQPRRRIAVAAAQDHTVLEAVKDAEERGLVEGVLFGDREGIHAAAKRVKYSPRDAAVVHEPDPVKAALGAVAMASKGEADMVMKGYLHTDDFLRAILNKEVGLRTGSIMSHVFIAENREMDRLLFIADGAMNIAPTLEQKAAILLNTVHIANAFGVMRPKVAVMAAVELINPAMPATLEAAALAQMSRRRQFSVDCEVDGPFALDNAVSELAAKHKKIAGPVAGVADVLLVPCIEAGNMLAKALVYLGGCRLAGLLVGAKVPVVLTSRSDSAESKLLSIASAVFTINLQRTLWLKVGKVHY
ncbi:MAG: bifunctional enoyl-CoA hydratase/phosphate acetyltransferase [Planctomycetes bacterium]|nr:bifunctional enoyl-CoA hydratase/phosphate acetyltransferase [Planctomycetota bacterium]